MLSSLYLGAEPKALELVRVKFVDFVCCNVPIDVGSVTDTFTAEFLADCGTRQGVGTKSAIGSGDFARLSARDAKYGERDFAYRTSAACGLTL